MKRKAIEKIEPAKTRKKGHIATVQTLDDIAIINVFNDKVLAVRYCINCKTGEHEYWTEKNGWKKGKLITAIEGNWYEWVWMKHDYKYPKIASEEDRKRLLDITQDKYCANDVWSRIDHMEYSYDYDIRQTAEHNRRAKINNFMIKAPKLPKDADEWFFEKTTGEDYMFKEKGTENFSCTNCGESFDRSELTPIHQGKKKATHNDMVRCPSCGKLVQVKTRTDHITAPPESLYKLDKIDETASVLRIFRVDIEWDSGRHRIEIDEEIRIVIYKQDLFKSNRYNYKIFYNIPWEGWHKSNNLNYRARDGYMYPGDYKGTLKNTAFLLWNKGTDGVWYCTREYYYSGRDKGRQKTDAEYAKDLESWLDGTEIKAVIVDPAAASFIAELRKRGFRVIKAKNDVEDGIRLVSTKLNLIKIIFSNVCQNTIKEFASYIWDAKAAERGEDKPIKQYDHAMDAVRYFVYTIFGDKPRLNRNLKGGL